MAVTLEKGVPLNLTKTDPSLRKALIGLGWDARTTNGFDFDLDASAILVGANGKVRSDADFIFYKQLTDAAGSVTHQGDNLTGDGDGDDEQILIDLNLVPREIERIIIVVSIYDAAARGQKFGQVRNSYIRVVNNETQSVVANYDLGEEMSGENSVIFAEIYRYAGEWKVKAVAQGYTDGLGGIARDFGVNIA
jgi:tellurium resistance protein TerD